MGREAHDNHGVLVTPGDPAVAALAFRQHGVVSRAQLEELGFSRGAIEHRLLRGRLQPFHKGVYAVGHARLTFRGRLWAAVLACGGPEAAVVSHRSAAALWDLLPTPGGAVEVTTLRRSASSNGIRVHRSRTLDPTTDVVHLDGLPLTTPTRTLRDLQEVLTPQRLERTLHKAEHLRLVDTTTLLAPSPGRRSVALRNALTALATTEPQLTRSQLEERFLALVEAHGLPTPEVNASLLGHEVDFLWRDARVVAETDGRATHLTATAFERDRERDAALQVAGYRVVRFTWRQLLARPAAVAATVRALT